MKGVLIKTGIQIFLLKLYKFETRWVSSHDKFS